MRKASGNQPHALLSLLVSETEEAEHEKKNQKIDWGAPLLLCVVFQADSFVPQPSINTLLQRQNGPCCHHHVQRLCMDRLGQSLPSQVSLGSH